MCLVYSKKLKAKSAAIGHQSNLHIYKSVTHTTPVYVIKIVLEIGGSLVR
jgi:hypothetical protein